ncbi:MAG: PAS domain S-box protein, partial [Nitrospirae bacterium]|nr:PAS domain S-box protein [Nitrospirota bacterium]
MELLDKKITELTEELKNERLRRQHSEAEVNALLKAASAVFEYKDFVISSRKIFDICKDITNAAEGYVALMSSDGSLDEVLFFDSVEFPCVADTNLPLPIRGLWDAVYRTGTVVYENNFSKSDRMKYLTDGHVYIKNVMFVPLKIDSKVVGIMYLANKNGGFTSRDAELSFAIGQHVVVALQNSRSRELLENNQKKIIEKEQQFHTAFEFSTIGIAITSPEKGWIDVNDQLCAMLGYSKNELINMTWAEITHPDDLQIDILQFNQVLAGEINGYRLDKRFIRKDGTTIYTTLLVNCNRNENNEVDYFIAILEDITERKKLEDELRSEIITRKETEALLKEKELDMVEAQNKAHFGTWTYDPVIQQSVWSLEMYKIYGLDPKIGVINYRDFKKFILPYDYNRFDNAVREAVEHGKPYRLELQISRPDNTVKTILNIGDPVLDSNGKVVKIRGSILDITVQTELENVIKQELAFQSSVAKVTEALLNSKYDK